MNEFKRFYVYEGSRPVGIHEGADQMTVDKINRLATYHKKRGQYMLLTPIRPGDFDFDPVSGRKLARIDNYVYPEFKKEV